MFIFVFSGGSVPQKGGRGEEERGPGSLVSMAISGQSFSAVAREPWDSSGVLFLHTLGSPGLTPLIFVVAVVVPWPVPSLVIPRHQNPRWQEHPTGHSPGPLGFQ